MKPLASNLIAITWACILASGCGRAPDVSLTAFGTFVPVSWSAPAEGRKPLPRIDQGTVYALGTAFVLWSDRAGGISVSFSATAQGSECKGSFLAGEGRHVDFRCESKDGRTGQATIDGIAYDAANGNLFALSTQGEPVRVKQLKQDLTALNFESAALAAFAREDKGLADFFTGSAGAK
jgi:hypothetical protein